MSKNKQQKHRQLTQPAKPTALLAPGGLSLDFGYDPRGPWQPVDIVSTKEGWSEFALEDGTIIRAKAVLLEVKKMTGQFNAEGEPIYQMQIIMANQARVPNRLKKKK